MKKFLTILSFLTTLSSSLVVVACKTDNVDKEVKNKEDKNEQNNNPRDNKNNKDKQHNNLKEKRIKNKEEKIEFKEENKFEKITESKPNSNNNSGSNNNNESNSNSGSLNGIYQKFPMSEMPNDQAPKDEEPFKKESENIKKHKQEVDEIISKMDHEKIEYLFKEYNSNLIQNEFDNKMNKISSLISDIFKLFDKYRPEELKTQISDLINQNSKGNYTWNEECKKKLDEILKQISKEEKNTIVNKIEELFFTLLNNESENKRKNLNNELDQLLKSKQYEKIKEKLYGMLEKSKNIEKAPLMVDSLIVNSQIH
ncbi:hypothetical protein MFERI14815_00488 [Mycoplasma feriruminatoris]|uniref:hypothetical protein n=1 Tax=Mycoplasma feriruminatoris TaxID=1179777 RepID=UPI00241F2E1A|nr:hypothetical protein [Mycoplasma feriruminatoris]WFQ91875.1 hypothetical protein MFERI14815_00488 [Mycoplasma feriruminatoris]